MQKTPFNTQSTPLIKVVRKKGKNPKTRANLEFFIAQIEPTLQLISTLWDWLFNYDPSNCIINSPDFFILLDYHEEALSKGLHIRYLPHFIFLYQKIPYTELDKIFFSVNCYWLLPVTINF